MARGTMHAPKPDEARRRRTAPQHGETVVTRDEEVRGPELGGAYGEDTREWWEEWRRSPQAALFERTDWSRLKMLARIVDAYFRRPSAAALGEIRMSEERLGATVVDRMRARIRIADDAPADDSVTPAGVTRLDTRRAIRDRLAAGE
ncbi:hypothetical protein ACPXB5_11250 [Micromonospora arida]|uniref:phage terminase small subunit n=1 Tax=Micromonospora arida TaxID=2203715 RepID=UPI003CF10F02